MQIQISTDKFFFLFCCFLTRLDILSSKDFNALDGSNLKTRIFDTRATTYLFYDPDSFNSQTETEWSLHKQRWKEKQQREARENKIKEFGKQLVSE